MGKPDHKCQLLEGRGRRETKGEGEETLYGLGGTVSITLPGGHPLGFSPGGSDGKGSTCNAGDLGSVSGLRRSPGDGNGNPRQYTCLENSMDRRAWRATVQGVAKRRT